MACLPVSTWSPPAGEKRGGERRANHRAVIPNVIYHVFYDNLRCNDRLKTQAVRLARYARAR
jgi:hypothetical protein